jgi:hypothetical protein
MTSQASKFVGLGVVPVVAVDQQLHANVLALANQIDPFGDGAEKPLNGPRAASHSRFSARTAARTKARARRSFRTARENGSRKTGWKGSGCEPLSDRSKPAKTFVY